MSEVPIPQDSGSAGTQETLAGELVRVNKESPLKGLPIAQRIEGLAATHSRSMGGDLSASLIAGSFAQLSADLELTRKELTDTREQLRQSQADLSKANQMCAVFEDRERWCLSLSLLVKIAGSSSSGHKIRNNSPSHGMAKYSDGRLGGAESITNPPDTTKL